ncbi:DMT family transporter [Aquibacillus koreensis]|uniref:DMT family transporter n=1 Tax=Aquibacillus koreensis TaxID=279446 RepID=A0A9X3WNM3_9BACI|nr:DMT family transporter [Aquibacillus koreensis]MCT2536946.1 DMT family transporter [Aquibacillus koreensis]MDC3421923.1 DMT family transporter [Aquibacillus koreensis]
MGILLLLLSTLMWSFVSILVKAASFSVDSYTITFLRFFIGVIFLFLFVWFSRNKVTITWKSKWIWYGALGKIVNYLFENFGVSIGYAYEQILVTPFLTIFMLLFSIFYFKEKATFLSWLAATLCISGVFLISWNGLPIAQLFEFDLFLTVIFAISALGASFHFVSQKVLIQKMGAVDMNLSIFLWCSVLTTIPLPTQFEWTGELSSLSILALVLLGFITGISFIIYAKGLKHVSFLIAAVLVNSSVLFTIFWSWLFFNEPITIYVILGSILFLVGMIVLSLPSAKVSNQNRRDQA